MECSSRGSWYKKLDELSCLRTHEADVFQLAFEASLAGDAEILRSPFDSDKVYLRVTLGRIDQKASLAETDLDFHRMNIAEHSLPVQDGILLVLVDLV